MRYCLLFCLTLCFLPFSSRSSAEEQPQRERPIQALLVTGGCCHDYDRQKLILTRGISARANVRWTVVQQGGSTTDTKIPLYDDPDWADGFDIVIHNECFAGVTDLEFVDRILKPHKNGVPAILIHCAMHCYRVKDDRWFEFVGLRSPGHGPKYAFAAENLKPDHPIMAGYGRMFEAPKGELYHAVEVFKSATPLAQANRQADGKPQVCVWTNDYEGTRVFGTTIGHYNETMVEPKYLDMMARGLLWAVGRDPEKHFHPASAEDTAAIKALVDAPTPKNSGAALPQPCCGAGNLAATGKATASSEEKSKNNFAKNAIDGNLATRWCANGGAAGQTWQVDLGEAKHVQSLRIHWEKNNAAYRYRVEASTDGASWKTIVDQSKNKKKAQITPHEVDAPDARFLRVTFLGAQPNYWGSIWEFEAYADKQLPELPKSTTASASGTNASIADVTAPPGFNVTLFGSPPQVNYPVCITAAATGEVFVGVDEQGSLGKEAGRGKVLRCIDTDGDGAADRINEFAKMDHPRGLIYDNGSLWVLHPPLLSVFRDTNGDGTSDESEVLITGISTEEVNRRGADHTTNGIRMGLEGWIYIAVGDFGFNKAVAKDGTTLSRRGGGVVRIRPDGTEMEIFSWGQRNILDVAIDPLMNLFTRDNTNDGGGWDIRLSHVLQTAHYGYPSLYKNFSEEIMPPLADYGGGSGCGVMYFQDARWPARFNDLVLTCDWGRSEVFSHTPPANGATFDAQQDTFLKIPRPTDIDVDASGRMFVSSWKNGKFAYGGPDVGFVAQITPVGYTPKPVADVRSMADDLLLKSLQHPSAAWRFTVQREILRRAATDPAAWVVGLEQIASDATLSLHTRAAGVFTLGQILSDDSVAALTKLLGDDALREYAIRALTDREQSAKSAPAEQIVAALADDNPRVQAAALVAVGRIYAAGRQGHNAEAKTKAANAVLALTPIQQPTKKAEGDDWRQAHPERVLPHLAMQALVRMNAVEACIAALKGPHQNGALWALKSMHDPAAVDGLFRTLGVSRDESLRSEIWTTLIRLYHREGDFTEDSPKWWGTRPDTTGPYYDRQKWSESDRIAAAVKIALAESDEALAAHLRGQLARHVVKLDGVSAADIAANQEPQEPIKPPAIDPDNPNQITNQTYEMVLKAALKTQGDATAGQLLFKAQSCIHCHTYANGQQPKGPHLVDIGKRYKTTELVESIVAPSKKIAQGFDTWAFAMDDGKVYAGFVVQESAETVIIRQADGLSRELLQDDIEERVKQDISMMPKGIVGNLTPQQLADLIAYLQTLH